MPHTGENKSVKNDLSVSLRQDHTIGHGTSDRSRIVMSHSPTYQSSELEEIKTPDIAAAPNFDPKQDNDAPDGGYGWVVACCVFAQNAATWGFATSMSSPLEKVVL